MKTKLIVFSLLALLVFLQPVLAVSSGNNTKIETNDTQSGENMKGNFFLLNWMRSGVTRFFGSPNAGTMMISWGVLLGALWFLSTRFGIFVLIPALIMIVIGIFLL